MIIKYRMPKKDLTTLKKFTLLPQEERDLFIHMTKTILPSLPKDGLKAVPEIPEEQLDDFSHYLQFFISLYINFYSYWKTIETFIDEVIISSIKSEDVELEISDEIKDSLEKILKMDDSLGICAKNIDLSTENPNIYFRAKIITDLRYIFFKEILKIPNYAQIYNTLKISYLKNEDLKQKFISLNFEQLKELKVIIERAISKENTIRKLSEKNNLKILEEVRWNE